MKKILILFIIVSSFLFSNEILKKEKIVVGVRAWKGVSIAHKEWDSTIKYLNKRINKYEFVLKPLVEYEKIKSKIEKKEIDFLISDPLLYVESEYLYGLTRIATLQRKANGLYFDKFGSVIFTSSKNKKLKKIDSLRNKVLMGVSKNALAGYRMAYREILNNNIIPERFFKKIEFSGGRGDLVVKKVLQNPSYVGTVRTGLLENMIKKGTIRKEDVHIINELKYEYFPFMLSTKLYPEFPFSRLSHIPDDLAREVLISLLSIKEDSKMAKDGKYARWLIPDEYSEVTNLMKDLKIGFFNQKETFSFVTVYEKYKSAFVIIFFLVFVLVILFFKTKRQEFIIKEERNRYKKLIENSSDAVFIVNLDGYLVECSNLFKSILGFEDKDISKLHVSDFEVLHTKEKIKENIGKTKSTPLRFKSKYKKKDGLIIDVSISIVRVKIKNKDFIYSTFRDISATKKAEELAYKTNDILKLIAKGTKASLVYDEIAHLYESRHQGMRCSMLELEEGRLLHGGAPSMPKEYCDAVHGLVNGPDIGSCGTSTYTGKRVIVEDISTDPKWANIKQFALPHGMRSCWSEPIKDSSGKVLGAFGMYYDYPAVPNEIESEDLTSAANLAGIIMERDHAQKELYKKQQIILEQTKLASMGEMIGNIAHQWRQPLSVITTSASGLQLYLELDDFNKEKMEDSLDSIIKQAKYLSNTIDNFRNFVKGSDSKENVNTLKVIDETIAIIDASLKNNFIELVLEEEDTAYILANKNELVEAFINILNNSKDILREEIKNEDDRIVFISIKKLNKNKIQFMIKDTGGGIPNTIINRIFEPYFTTKHQSQGTGLGLSIVDKIIRERNDGLLSVENLSFTHKGKQYRGACFKITFNIISS